MYSRKSIEFSIAGSKTTGVKGNELSRWSKRNLVISFPNTNPRNIIQSRNLKNSEEHSQDCTIDVIMEESGNNRDCCTSNIWRASKQRLWVKVLIHNARINHSPRLQVFKQRSKNVPCSSKYLKTKRRAIVGDFGTKFLKARWTICI